MIDKDRAREILGKALIGGIYAAIAELAATKVADKDTLMMALAVSTLRGLAVFTQELYREYKEPIVAAYNGKMSWLRECL